MNCVTLVPKPGRKEGYAVREPSLLRGIAVLRRSGSTEKRRSPGAAEAVVLEQKKNRWDRRLAGMLLGRGGMAAVREGAEESVPFASGPEPAAIHHVWGGSGN